VNGDPVSRSLTTLAIASTLLGAPRATLAAQDWNSPAALALASRATEARRQAQGDSALRSYHTIAHGMVFFLAQVGDQLQGQPRLVKADELNVEVYWHAPDVSKQIIVGWRDGRWLPTDINYHRDHLGIVTSNFGDRILIGEGDEVRDVVHPLSADGLLRYDFALADSVRFVSRGETLLVYELQVRPKDLTQPLVVGTLSLDARSAQLVRFKFSFTPAAYLEKELEDITVSLENARFEDRWWLPYRQDIEIRRGTQWLDFPARGIIRGRWEIGDYDFDVVLPPGVLRGPAIGGLREPSDTGYVWDQTLAEAVGDAVQPEAGEDLEALRSEAARIAGRQIIGGIQASRPAAGSLSDLIHVNRVQGLALGVGAVFHMAERRVEVRPRIGFGTADARVTGGLSLGLLRGGTRLTLAGDRSLRDLSDYPVISGVVNSLTSQEAGDDHGDYVLLDQVRLSLGSSLSETAQWTLSAGYENATSVGVEATPATGTYRANPSLGAPQLFVGRAAVSLTPRSLKPATGVRTRPVLTRGAIQLEGSTGDVDFVRISGDGALEMSLGSSSLELRAAGGWGSAELPAYRSFVLGGRGTLPGEPFRGYGGRTFMLARMEWDVPVPFFAMPLGAYATTGRTLTLGPFLAAGWSDRSLAGTPWRDTPGVRPVAGLAAECFMRLLRVEAGVGLRTGDVTVLVDFSPAWWGVL
jgi:hypothetical protein